MLDYDQSEQAEMPEASGFSVKIIGVGGAGANVLDRMALEGTEDADMLTLNTDVRALSTSVSNNKIQLGKEMLKGMGAGGDPELGRQAAMEVESQIREAIKGHAMVFVCAGLGGGTGSGAAPEVCRIAKEEGVFLVAFTTLPFDFEGARRMQQAKDALARINDHANAVVTFENDRMGNLIVPKDGIQSAFAAADKTISESVRATTNIVTQPGIIRIGMDDLLSALRNRDSRCLFGHGQAKGDNRASEALAQALKSPLLDKGKLLDQTRNVLVHVAGGDDLNFFEVQSLMKELSKHVSENTQLMFGVGTDKKLGASLTVTIISSLSETAPTDNAPTPDQDDPEKKKIAPSNAAGTASQPATASTVAALGAVGTVAAAAVEVEGVEEKQVEPAPVDAADDADDDESSAVDDAKLEDGDAAGDAAETLDRKQPEQAVPAVEEDATVEAEDDGKAVAAAEVEPAAEIGSADAEVEVEPEVEPEVEENAQDLVEEAAEISGQTDDEDTVEADKNEAPVSDEPKAVAEPQAKVEPEPEPEAEAKVEPEAEAEVKAEVEAAQEAGAPEAEAEEEPVAILPPVTGPPAELLEAFQPVIDDKSVEDSEVVDLDDVDDPNIDAEGAETVASKDESVLADSKTIEEKAGLVDDLEEAKSAKDNREEIDHLSAADDDDDDDDDASPLSMAGPSWSGLKTTGNIGALLREGRLPSSGSDSGDNDDDDDHESVSPLGKLDPLVDPPQSKKSGAMAGGLPGAIESPFEIGDENDDDDDDVPVGTTVPSGLASPPWAAGAAAIPGLNVGGQSKADDADDRAESESDPVVEDAGGVPSAPMSIRDMAAKKSTSVEPDSPSNELEFVEPTSKAFKDGDSAPAEKGFGEALKGLTPLPGLSNDLVVGSGTANSIKLTRIQDEARVDTTPIAPLESLEPEPDDDGDAKSAVAEDVNAPDVSDEKSISSVINPAPAPVAVPPSGLLKPVAISPISPPPGLTPTEGRDEDDADDPANQAMLNLEPKSKGRFAKSEPTIVDGLDLDVPTLLRGSKDS